MKGLRKRNGSYYGEFYDPDKRPRRREYPLRTGDIGEAEIIYARKRKEYALGSFDPWKDQPQSRVTLEGAVEEFNRSKRRQTLQTRRAYETTLRLFQDKCRAASPDAISERHVERFILGGKQEGAGDYTVRSQNTHLQRLNTFMRWCIQRGYAEENPVLSFWHRLDAEQPKRRKQGQARREFMMPEDLARWSAQVQLDVQPRSGGKGGKMWGRGWALDMAEASCCTGLRESDMCALNRDHVRLRMVPTARGPQPLAGQLRLVDLKTGGDLSVPLVPRAALIFHRWLSAAKDEDPEAPVFTGPRGGRRVQPVELSERFTEYRVKAKLRPAVTYHSTRHTFISWMLMLGLPIYHVKELAGHSRTEQTEEYAHMARRFLHGQASEIAEQILSFYCPGLEPDVIRRASGAASQGGGLAAYAWGSTALLDVLFGAALYRDAKLPEDMSKAMSAAGDAEDARNRFFGDARKRLYLQTSGEKV